MCIIKKSIKKKAKKIREIQKPKKKGEEKEEHINVEISLISLRVLFC